MFLYDELSAYIKRAYPNDPNCKRVMEVLYKQMSLCSRQQSGVEGNRLVLSLSFFLPSFLSFFHTYSTHLYNLLLDLGMDVDVDMDMDGCEWM